MASQHIFFRVGAAWLDTASFLLLACRWQQESELGFNLLRFDLLESLETPTYHNVGFLFEPLRRPPACTPDRALFGDDSKASAWRDAQLLSRHGCETVLVETITTLNRNEDGLLGTVIAFRDVTARRAMEKQARQSRSMETVSVMAGALAHDLNNLLNIILGYAELVQSDDKRRCSEVEQIERAGMLAAGLGRQLLTVACPDDAKNVVLELNAAILASAKMLKHVLTSNREMVMRTRVEPQYILADPGRIQQLLLNLTINARDAMPGAGRLTISTAEGPSGFVELSVQDNGIGMDVATVDRIFEPFFSRKGTKGTGLGMTIVHNVVAQSGGTIEVQSEPGRGTTFRILFPRADAQHASEWANAGGALERAASGGLDAQQLQFEGRNGVEVVAQQR